LSLLHSYICMLLIGHQSSSVDADIVISQLQPTTFELATCTCRSFPDIVARTAPKPTNDNNNNSSSSSNGNKVTCTTLFRSSVALFGIFICSNKYCEHSRTDPSLVEPPVGWHRQCPLCNGYFCIKCVIHQWYTSNYFTNVHPCLCSLCTPVLSPSSSLVTFSAPKTISSKPSVHSLSGYKCSLHCSKCRTTAHDQRLARKRL
jgi:hypothetical protein